MLYTENSISLRQRYGIINLLKTYERYTLERRLLGLLGGVYQESDEVI